MCLSLRNLKLLKGAATLTSDNIIFKAVESLALNEQSAEEGIGFQLFSVSHHCHKADKYLSRLYL